MGPSGQSNPLARVMSLGYDLETDSSMSAKVLQRSHMRRRAAFASRWPTERFCESGEPSAVCAHDGSALGTKRAAGAGTMLYERDARGGLSAVTIQSIQPETEPVPVFDLTVADCHNYFAGGVLAHNKPP